MNKEKHNHDAVDWCYLSIAWISGGISLFFLWLEIEYNIFNKTIQLPSVFEETLFLATFVVCLIMLKIRSEID